MLLGAMRKKLSIAMFCLVPVPAYLGGAFSLSGRYTGWTDFASTQILFQKPVISTFAESA